MTTELLEPVKKIKTEIDSKKSLLSDEVLTEETFPKHPQNLYQNSSNPFSQNVTNSALKYIKEPYTSRQFFINKNLPELEAFLIYLVLEIFPEFNGRKKLYEIADVFFKNEYTKDVIKNHTDLFSPEMKVTYDRVIDRIRVIKKNPQKSMIFLLNHKYLHYHIGYYGNLAKKFYANRVEGEIIFLKKRERGGNILGSNSYQNQNQFQSHIPIQIQNEDSLDLNENMCLSTSSELESLFQEDGI